MSTNPFFHPLGTNGRACVTCHAPDQAWSITPSAIQAKFNSTGGTDPLFRTVDGANSPDLPVGTVAERLAAYSELLNKGLIRVGLPIPSGAQFVLVRVDDPYNFASPEQLSLFRRPLPTTNIAFLSSVQWDGRAVGGDGSIADDLEAQAVSAVATHEQGTQTPDAAERDAIVGLETHLFTAQSWDTGAGALDADGATGGPVALSTAPFHLGINDVAGDDPTGEPFTRDVFDLYDTWSLNGGPTETAQARASVARGERIFNIRPFAITGVAGLNDVVRQATIIGTCSTCHDTPSVGNHSLAVYLNIGLADAIRRTADLPLYTLQNRQTGALAQTTDPGRALVTGNWADIGKVKIPVLRGLAARPPYFHNGSAPSLDAVVNFYNQRFDADFTPQEQQDLAAFLRSL